MIRSALAARIIFSINTYHGALNRITLFITIFGGILVSCFSVSSGIEATFTSYFPVFLAALVVQRDIGAFLRDKGGAELVGSESLQENRGTGVALYLRVSTDRQAEKGYSLQDQEERLTKEATERLKALHIYKIVDAGESGTDFNRKGLGEILEHAMKKRIQYVLVTSLDRIGRDLIESLHYVRKLRDLGVKIIAAGSEADIDTEEGLMTATIQFLSAELTNKSRARSAAAGRIQSFKSKHWGRPVPLGYHKRKDCWIEKEPAWESLVKEVFDHFLKLESYREVTEIVNGKYRDILVKPLTRHQVGQILHDPIYMGRPQYAGKLTVDDVSLAFLSCETFKKVQELSERIHGKHRRKKVDALQEFMKEYGLEVLTFVPNIAILCPSCNGIMVKNGAVCVGEWAAHNYLCRNCGKQRKVLTKHQMRKIQEWVQESLNSKKVNRDLGI